LHTSNLARFYETTNGAIQIVTFGFWAKAFSALFSFRLANSIASGFPMPDDAPV